MISGDNTRDYAGAHCTLGHIFLEDNIDIYTYILTVCPYFCLSSLLCLPAHIVSSPALLHTHAPLLHVDAEELVRNITTVTVTHCCQSVPTHTFPLTSYYLISSSTLPPPFTSFFFFFSFSAYLSLDVAVTLPGPNSLRLIYSVLPK